MSRARARGCAGTRYPFLTLKERDNETGLDYFLARYYSSTQGRFTSTDSFAGSWINPQTLNLYSYTMGNPLMFIDPSGNTAENIHGDIDRPIRPQGGCGRAQGHGCLWMGQDPKKVEQKPPTVFGPAGSDGSREIPGDGDLIVSNISGAKFPGTPDENPGETPFERYTFSPKQTAFEVIDWASKGIKKTAYSLTPDYFFVTGGHPLLGSVGLTFSKDRHLYLNVTWPYQVNPKRLLNFGGQGGVGYFVTTKMTKEQRDSAITGMGHTVSTPYTPLGAYFPENGPPAVTLGWPFSLGHSYGGAKPIF